MAMHVSLVSERRWNRPTLSLAVLEETYSISIAGRLRDRLRAMCAAVYAAFVSALEDGFDHAMRAHLNDVLQELMARGPELADLFQEELLCRYRRSVAALKESGAADMAPVGPLHAINGDVVRSVIRGADTLHGGTVLATTQSFLELLGRSTVDFRCPWSPAQVTAAYGVVLRSLEVPIHPRVEVILYRLFARDVLRYLGDACLAFRDAWPAPMGESAGAVTQGLFAPDGVIDLASLGPNVTPIRPGLGPILLAAVPFRQDAAIAELPVAPVGARYSTFDRGSLISLLVATLLALLMVGASSWLIRNDGERQVSSIVDSRLLHDLPQRAVIPVETGQRDAPVPLEPKASAEGGPTAAP